jgi:hypothetical protein
VDRSPEIPCSSVHEHAFAVVPCGHLERVPLSFEVLRFARSPYAEGAVPVGKACARSNQDVTPIITDAA